MIENAQLDLLLPVADELVNLSQQLRLVVSEMQDVGAADNLVELLNGTAAMHANGTDEGLTKPVQITL